MQFHEEPDVEHFGRRGTGMMIVPGMTFTIEPGLYFRADDELIPEEFRGIGVRIEDDVIVNEDGSVTRISENIPRTIEDVEAWIAAAQQS